MATQTNSYIQRLLNGECGTALISDVIADLVSLNRYRAEMDKMQNILKDVEFEDAEEERFGGIEDLEKVAEGFVELTERVEDAETMNASLLPAFAAEIASLNTLKKELKKENEVVRNLLATFQTYPAKCDELRKENYELKQEKRRGGEFEKENDELKEDNEKMKKALEARDKENDELKQFNEQVTGAYKALREEVLNSCE